MVPGLELVAGYLAAWAIRKARRVGARVDAEADLVIDAELDRLHKLVTAKLGTNPALDELERAASSGQEITGSTRRSVTDALTAAAAADPQFAAQLDVLLAALNQIGSSAMALATGDRAPASGRDVNIAAVGGSAAAMTMGDVTLGSVPPDPPGPGRRSD